MKSSYPLSKQFSFSILAIQFLIIHSVSSLNLTNDYLNHKCLINQGKYNFGSEFEQNLNQVFHHISTSAYNNVGFAHTTIGTTPQNSVTATLQCRGDSYGSKCRACVAIAIAEVNESSIHLNIKIKFFQCRAKIKNDYVKNKNRFN